MRRLYIILYPSIFLENFIKYKYSNSYSAQWDKTLEHVLSSER